MGISSIFVIAIVTCQCLLNISQCYSFLFLTTSSHVHQKRVSSTLFLLDARRSSHNNNISLLSQTKQQQPQQPIFAWTRTSPPTTYFQSLVLYESPRGDRIREETGIRPSLHPTTINAIAEALKIRASKNVTMPLRIVNCMDKYNGNDQILIKPIDVAIAAGKIAAKAIEQRQASSVQDGMEFTVEESQTVAGRVVGVVMRLDPLEKLLYEKVSRVAWIQKYDAWDSFGVVATASSSSSKQWMDEPPQPTQPREDTNLVDSRIEHDPLFCMNRSECLLAIFLQTIEIPQLAAAGQSVPDKSVIDFLDTDKAEVLLA